MTPDQLKLARLAKDWSQQQAAARLGVSQPYLHMLETGKRRLTPALARKLAVAYGLAPDALPLAEGFQPSVVPQDDLVESLAKAGYPGFGYLRTRGAGKNPLELLLLALSQPALEPRVAEALPWLLLRYGRDTDWLVAQARQHNLQNRLGFVVNLARQLSARDPQAAHRTKALRALESALEESRLAKQDVFYRPPRTPGEREWLEQNRPEEARHWNLLSDMTPAHLQYAG